MATQTKPRTKARKVKKHTASADVWDCTCEKRNPAHEPLCVGCHLNWRPGLADRDAALSVAVETDAEATAAWRKFTKSGAGDSTLLSACAEVFSQTGANVVSTDFGPLAYDYHDRRPRVWFNADEPPTGRQPDLEDKGLADALRRIYLIRRPNGKKPALPQSRESRVEGREQESPAATPKPAAGSTNGAAIAAALAEIAERLEVIHGRQEELEVERGLLIEAERSLQALDLGG